MLATRIAGEHALYGRTTGVGENRDVAADDQDGEHGRRLLAATPLAMAPSCPTKSAGRSRSFVPISSLSADRGVAPSVAEARIGALRLGLVPVVRRHGGIGTGDITVLAELGHALLGEMAVGRRKRRGRSSTRSVPPALCH